MFVCLDVHDEHQRVVVLNLLHGRLCRQGELDDGVVVQPGREDKVRSWTGGTSGDLHPLTVGSGSGASVVKSWNQVLSYFDRLNHHVHPASGDLQHSAVTHLFLRGALLRGYLGCRRRRRVLGRRKVGVVLIFFFLWLWTPLSTAFLAFRALDLASVLAGTAKMEGRIS